MKHPILQSYSLEELLYEYHDHVERQKAQEELKEQVDDKIEEEKLDAFESWADEEEAAEEELLRKKAAEKAAELKKREEEEKELDPRLDPANIEWMEKIMEEEKQKHGEDFGEDVEVEF